MRVLLMAFTLITLAGCATEPVQPWERGTLAKNEMQWAPDPLEAVLRDHIYFSKEASTGGGGAAGGGCGCN